MAARRPAADAAAGPEVDLTLTPFCTDDGSGHWALNDEISQMFVDEARIHRKVSLSVVFELPGAGMALPSGTKKGLFIVKHPIKVDDDGNLSYLLVLRHVDLTATPQWGTLALLLASHAIFVREGHVHSEGFRNLNFLTKLMDVSMVSSGGSASPDESAELNARLLKHHMPKLTYVVVDVDKKECGGDAFPAYFEKMLTTHPQNDFATTSVLANFFTQRDCIAIKSTMFKVPNAPYTAAKVVGAATDGHAIYKPFFGRYLSCGILVHLLHAVVPPLSTNAWAALPFRDLFTDVSITYWHELTDNVIGTYADWMHVKVLPYEPVKVDGAMVVDLTEIKMGIKQSDQDFHVIDHGQGDHSVFDEYGNLKKTKVAKDSASPSAAASTLDVGILQFLKQKRGGLQRQASIAVVRAPAQDSEDSQFDVYFDKMRAYEVPVKYIQNQQREKMPLDSRTLEAKHAECAALATAALSPFMALSVSSRDDVIFTGEHALAGAVHQVHATLARLYNEFQTANAAASAAFCSKLVRYLHGVVVEKTHLDDPSTASVSQSKLMLFLIAYRANVEALVSQYNFLAKGPAAQAVLTGFLQAVVPAHVQKAVVAAHRSFELQQSKHLDAIAQGKQSLIALNQSLAESNGVRMDCMRREVDGQRLVDERKAEQARMVESSIAEAEAQIARALREKEALFAKTVETTQATVATVEIIAKKPKEFSGYLFRQEGSGLLGKKWKQSFFVLKDGRFLCFKAKSYYEENRESMEPPLNVSGYTVLESRSHGNEFKLAPPTAGRTYCFRAPSDDDKQLWVQKFNEASNF